MAFRLRTEDDCRRYLANLINRLEVKEVSISRADTLGRLTKILLHAIAARDLADRVAELEKIVRSRGWQIARFRDDDLDDLDDKKLN